jgi:transposase
MFSERTSVGLDVHARSTTAWALDSTTGEIFTDRLVVNTADVVAWVRRLPQPAAVAYEAGPTGFVLARALQQAGIRCVVAAPSKMERPAGDRVKTDKRDAQRIAKLLRLDELPAVRVPDLEQEAARDLTRARDDVRADLMRARHRVAKLLLRRGIVYTDGRAWTAAHHHWLTGYRFDEFGLRVAYDEALETVWALEARRTRLDAAITELAAQPAWAPAVRRLACMRGVSTFTAFGLAVEIGDWHRFTGSTIGSYLGLVPSEDSSGSQRRQGGITKTGNTHARRLLVEAAWHHRRPYRRPGAGLQARLDHVAAPVRQRAERGNRRLHQRWLNLDARHKRSTISVVAVARELSGWCWSLAIMED